MPVSEAEAVDVDAALVMGAMTGRPCCLAEVEVLLAAAGRDVDDAGAFFVRDLVPGDDAVLRRRRCLTRQLVERAAVRPADQVAAGSVHLAE